MGLSAVSCGRVGGTLDGGGGRRTEVRTAGNNGVESWTTLDRGEDGGGGEKK